MQRCTFCGTELRDNARFCTHCGQTLNSHNGNAYAPGEQRTDVHPEEDLATSSTLPLSARRESEQELSRVPTSSLVAEDVHTPHDQSPDKQEEQLQPSAVLPDLPQTEASAEHTLSVTGNEPEEDSSQISNVPTSKLNGLATPTAVAQEPEPADTAVVAPQSLLPSRDAPVEDDAVGPVTAPQQPVAPGVRRKRSSGRLLLILGLVAVVIIAGGVGTWLLVAHPFSTGNAGGPVVVTSPTTDTVPTAVDTPCSNGTICPNTPNPLNSSKLALTFSDAVSGPMAVTSVIACGVEQSVAGGQQYRVSVLGTVNKQAYGFSFDAYPYTNPGTYTGVVTSFFGPAGDSSSLTQWRTISTQGVSVMVNSDGKSGTLNINLVNSSDHSTVSAVGTWTCA